jgi:hypothetical protein
MGEGDRRELSDEPVRPKPLYEPPMIISYSGDEILAEIGPALACSPTPCNQPPGTPLGGDKRSSGSRRDWR